MHLEMIVDAFTTFQSCQIVQTSESMLITMTLIFGSGEGWEASVPPSSIFNSSNLGLSLRGLVEIRPARFWALTPVSCLQLLPHCLLVGPNGQLSRSAVHQAKHITPCIATGCDWGAEVYQAQSLHQLKTDWSLEIVLWAPVSDLHCW